MQTPAVYPLTLQPGDDAELVFTVKAGGAVVDLSGWTGRLQFRKIPETWRIIATIEAEITFATGRVRFRFASALTQELPSSCVYDAKMIDPEGNVHTYLRGNVSTTRGARGS